MQWLGPLQVTQPITTFLRRFGIFFANLTSQVVILDYYLVYDYKADITWVFVFLPLDMTRRIFKIKANKAQVLSRCSLNYPNLSTKLVKNNIYKEVF